MPVDCKVGVRLDLQFLHELSSPLAPHGLPLFLPRWGSAPGQWKEHVKTDKEKWILGSWIQITFQRWQVEIRNGDYKGHKQIICSSKKEEWPSFFCLTLEKKGITHFHKAAKTNLCFSNYLGCISFRFSSWEILNLGSQMQIIFILYLNKFKICNSIVKEIASAFIILIYLTCCQV